MIQRIAILGTGLLGTSAGLALRASGLPGQIIGWNRGKAGAELALALRAIDSLAADLPADKAHFAEKNRAYFN